MDATNESAENQIDEDALEVDEDDDEWGFDLETNKLEDDEEPKA